MTCGGANCLSWPEKDFCTGTGACMDKVVDRIVLCIQFIFVEQVVVVVVVVVAIIVVVAVSF